MSIGWRSEHQHKESRLTLGLAVSCFRNRHNSLSEERGKLKWLILEKGSMQCRSRLLTSSSKLVTTVVSTFTSYYIHLWTHYFTNTALSTPLPSFDGRAIEYPNKDVLRDYMNWRQADCKCPS